MTPKSKRRLRKLMDNIPEGHEYRKGYLRVYKKYSIDEVLDHLGEECVVFDGYRVKMRSLRYLTFDKSTTCVTCGREGRYFRLEKHALHADIGHNAYHFNLYGFNHRNHEILMTKDHIIPKSKGGPSEIGNLQTMCTLCNRLKGDKLP